MSKYIAFYLPQFHPVPENDKWYGKGFTEWTNVAKAKPLFLGHYEPHIPGELGFYDLRLPETRREQAKLAMQYGIDAFCYWHYWFGNGKQILEMPIWEVYKDKSIKLPFCLAWANHSWEKKMWDKKGGNEIILEQRYLGEKDYSDFFYSLLPLFKDERYFKVDGRLFFAIYNPLENKDIRSLICLWRQLAIKEGIPDFYFVGKDSNFKNHSKIIDIGFDSVYEDNLLAAHHNMNVLSKVFHLIERKIFKRPTVIRYKKAINYMVPKDYIPPNTIPVVAPNWDHSPRSGSNAIILHDCRPEYFEKLLMNTEKLMKNIPNEERIVIVKSWNEWGEGNHLEPDLKYGKGYLEALKKIKELTNV